jgi:uncharacterized membrane protein
VTIHVPARPTRSTGWVPFTLVAVILIPAVAGSLRLVEVFGGPHLVPASRRISASPVPVVVHIVCAVAYAVLGAFQFSAALRRGRPGWHRAAGRVLVVLGLAVSFSALWMTQFYPRQPGTGELAYVFRLAFGSGMAASIILGFVAIRRGVVARHRAWMTRTRWPSAPAPRCSPRASVRQSSAPGRCGATWPRPPAGSSTCWSLSGPSAEPPPPAPADTGMGGGSPQP